MIAQRSGRCFKCSLPFGRGTPVKQRFVRTGFNPDTGKPTWDRRPGEYVHEVCPKVEQRRVDPATGEILTG